MIARLRGLLASTVLGFLLAACNVVIATAVNADGSGELRTEVTFTAEEVEGFVQTPGNESRSICDDLNRDLQPDVSFVEEQRDDATVCVSTQPFADLDELKRLYDRMGNVTVNQLAMTGSDFVFDVNVDLPAASPDGQPTQPTYWHLTPPGVIGDHNADRVNNQTLIWEIEPGQTTNLHAETSLPALNLGGLEILALGMGLALCVGLIVGGGIVALVLRRRRAAA